MKEQQVAEFDDGDEDAPVKIITQATPNQDVKDDDFEDFEAVQEKMSTVPQKKKEGGFMSRLFSFGSKKQRVEEEDDEQEMVAVQQHDQDIETLKDTIKILHKWLEKLPPERISEFKRSPDFEKYKDALRKLGMIKE